MLVPHGEGREKALKEHENKSMHFAGRHEKSVFATNAKLMKLI